MPTPPPLHLEAPPDPLPTVWARAIANSIASELRRGWRAHAIKSTMHPTGAPRSHNYSSASTFAPQLPTTYLESRELYAQGLVDPIPQLGVPWLAWHTTQLDLAAALINANALSHAQTVQAWLNEQRANRPANLFVLRPNRHGRLNLRRNSEHAPEAVADSFLAAATAATVWLPDPRDVNDWLDEPISLDEIKAALEKGVSS